MGNSVKLLKGQGYWDVTKYPYGGDFKRVKENTFAIPINGTVKLGDEMRMKIISVNSELENSANEIVIKYVGLDMPSYEDKSNYFDANKKMWQKV